MAELSHSWLGRTTQARVGLGRAGQALPTAALLDFQLAHARARDAVQAVLDTDALAAALATASNQPAIMVRSQAADLVTHLQRPDLGRRLDPADAALLAPGDWDLAIVVGDGLSAKAVQAHAVPIVAALRDRLPGWRIAPPVVARQARVALGDDIGAALGARLVLVLIGERPGLSASDSLGAYLTFAPQRGRADSDRNCVSNIRPPHGLAYFDAADRIAWLLSTAQERGLSGVALKDDAPLPNHSVAKQSEGDAQKL